MRSAILASNYNQMTQTSKSNQGGRAEDLHDHDLTSVTSAMLDESSRHDHQNDFEGNRSAREQKNNNSNNKVLKSNNKKKDDKQYILPHNKDDDTYNDDSNSEIPDDASLPDDATEMEKQVRGAIIFVVLAAGCSKVFNFIMSCIFNGGDEPADIVGAVADEAVNLAISAQSQ